MLHYRYKERIKTYAETFHLEFYRPLGKAVRLVEHVAKVGSGHTYNLYADNNVFYAFQTKGADYMKLGPSHIDLCHDSVLDPLVVLFPLAIIMFLYISIGIVCDIMRKVKVKKD